MLSILNRTIRLLSLHRARKLVGTTFGNWRLESFVGAGSFGAGFLAVDDCGATAILKLINPIGHSTETARTPSSSPTRQKPFPRRGDDQPWSERIWAECAALQRCEGHSAIPRWRGIVNERGRYFIVIDRMPGKALSRMLEEGHRFTDDEIGIVASDLSKALAHAHQRGVSHNDVRPANVLFDGSRAALVDFGLATFFPPENTSRDFAASSVDDRSGIADIILFLLYTRYEGPPSRRPWSEELRLPALQHACLLNLFAEETPYTAWNDVLAAVAAAFPA